MTADPDGVARPTFLDADASDFEALFEEAPCGYLVTTPGGVVTRANATFERMTGHSRADVIGRPFTSLLTMGSRMFHETRHVPVLKLKGEAGEVALSLQCADGTTLPTLVNSVLVEDSEPPELRIALFDSTERRDYERDLLAARRAAEASEARVRTLQMASTAFTVATTVDELSAALATSVREAFSASHTAVLLLDASGDLQLAAGSHPLHEFATPDVPLPETEAIRVGRVLTVSTSDDADSNFPGLGALLRSARIEAFSAAPLTDKGVAAGVVVSFFGREREFDAGTVELLEVLATQAAHVLARIRLQEQLAQLALIDQLTGLANRKLLQVRLAQTLATATRNPRSLAILFLDLDGFKVVNDSCGHAVGDAVLQQVAARLRRSVRAGETIARYGGDEFVIICEDTDAEAAMLIADRIRASVSEPLDDVPPAFTISVSIGIALLGPDDDAVVTSDGILGLADAAMYQSKNAGKDRVTVVHVERSHPPADTASVP